MSGIRWGLSSYNMAFTQINFLAEKSKKPLQDKWLEGLQNKYGEHHNYYRFLYHLAVTFQPKVSLEIGTWYGIGSAYMCAAAQTYGGQVIGLDLNRHELARKTIPERFGNYHFLQRDSREAGETVRQLVNEYGPIGLVYQDSSHHYEASCLEWEIYSPMLVPGAVWFCDDITEDFHDPKVDPPGKGMLQYFAERSGQKKVFVDVLHKGNTMGVILP